MRDRAAADMVQERWDLADDGREDYASQAIENERLYRAKIDETSHPYLSNICLPWSYTIVESYLGKCVQMLAGMLPYCRVIEEDDDSRAKAKKVEKDANMCLYLQKWTLLAYKVYKQAFKYPCGWVEIDPWGVVEGREMPIFRGCNWFNVWVNPTITSFQDPDSYLIKIDYIPIRELKKLDGNPHYRNLRKIEKHEGTIFTGEEEEVRAIKGIPTRRDDKYSELVKVTKYWSYDDFIVTTNDTNVIRNDEQNPFGVIPYKKITPLPLEDEFYGMSILDEGKDLFTTINENENQFNDAVNLMLNPQWIVSRSADVKRSTILTKTGGIIWTDDVNGIVPMKIDWNLLTASMSRKARLEQDIMNYSNAFPQMRGQPQQGQETATEYMGMRSAGELRSDTYNLLLAMMSVEDMINSIVYFKKIFMTDPTQFYYPPEGEPATVMPEDYYGNFTYKAVAQYKMQREIERKQFIESMTFIFGNQAFLPLIMPRVDEWLDRLLSYFDLRNPEQLWASPQEQMMQQMAMMLGGGGMPGQLPGTQPALGEKEMRQTEGTPNVGIAPLLANLRS